MIRNSPASETVAPPPTRVEWRRDGYSVWADEDGVHLKTPGGGFEMPEAMALVDDVESEESIWKTVGATEVE